MTWLGSSPSPERQPTQSATVGQVIVFELEPTTSPKWPALSASSYTSARGAAWRIARTPAAGAISSTVPTTDRIGHSMSASVTRRSSITNPPSSIRLWAMNWRRKSAIAGPGQATQPSASRNRRWRSRGSSASRSCSASRKSSRLRTDLTGSSSRKPVRLAHAGSAQPPNTRSASTPAAPAANCSGIPNGIASRVSTGLPNVITDASDSLRR